MEMNRGSLNPLFVRHPSALTTPIPSPTPLYPSEGSPPHGLFPLHSRASPVRPCRFVLYSLPPSLRSTPVLSTSTSFFFPTTIFFLLSLSHVRAKSTRAAAAAVCPPNYAEFISYGARHACRQPLPVTFIPAVIYERERAVYTVEPAAATFFARPCGNVIFRAFVCDVSIRKHRLRQFLANWSCRCTSLLREAN